MDSHWERDLVQDVFDLEARRNLDHYKALRLEPEHGALRDVQDDLFIFSRLLGTERQVVDLIDKFFVPALEREAETYKPCTLRDVDKAAGADHAPAQAAHVHIAFTKNLPGAHERRIRSLEVVKIDGDGMRDERSGVSRDAVANPAGRRAAVDPGLDSERDC